MDYVSIKEYWQKIMNHIYIKTLFVVPFELLLLLNSAEGYVLAQIFGAYDLYSDNFVKSYLDELC